MVTILGIGVVPVQASYGQVMVKPVNGYISQEFGGGHQGIDIAAPYGTYIRAPSNGRVEDIGWGSYGEGLYIVISHIPGDSNQYGGYCPSQTWTKYFHLSVILVYSGQYVSQGQLIGLVGDTGYTTGYHLHFQIHENGRYGVVVNPREYVRFYDGLDIW